MLATYNEGGSVPGLYPTTQLQVLAALVGASGVPTPPSPNLASYVVVTKPNAPVAVMSANPQRTFLALYNPTQAPVQFALGTTALYGARANLPVGPGQAYFWANAQGLASVYTGAITAISPIPGIQFFAWEDAANLTANANLINDAGVLQLAAAATGYPTSPTGRPAGALWNNGGVISIVPGVTPNPTAPPVFFGATTAAAILALGGGNFPTSDPGVGNQLWNNGGLACISLGGGIGPRLDFSQLGNSMYIPVVF